VLIIRDVEAFSGDDTINHKNLAVTVASSVVAHAIHKAASAKRQRDSCIQVASICRLQSLLVVGTKAGINVSIFIVEEGDCVSIYFASGIAHLSSLFG
jgi:hypothetical protein